MNKKIAKAVKNPEITYGALSSELRELLEKIAIGKKEKHVRAEPFSRYGNSGSKLYLVFFTPENTPGVPYLLKTFKKKKEFLGEKEAIRKLDNTIADAEGEYFPGEELSGILTKYHGKDEQKIEDMKPTTIREIMYNTKGFTDKKICDIIKNTFVRLKNAYSTKNKISCNVRKKYKKYIRNDETRKKIASLTKSKIEDKEIEIFGHNQLNPVYVYDHLPPTKEITVSLIHGDFHPDNVVMNSEKCPRIIDFRWSQEHDIYLDFAMLEMSARYWHDRNTCFYMDQKTKDAIEENLLKKEVDYDYLSSLTKDKKVKRMLIIVREIRKNCKDILGTEWYSFEDHIFAQFVVLYGLQKFAWEYNPYRVIPVLGSLGSKLRDLGLLILDE